MRPLIHFFVWGSVVNVCCPAVLSLLNGLYRVHGLRVSSCVLLLADITCLLFLFKNLSIVVFSFFPFFFTMRSFFFIFGLLAISYPLVSLPDYGSHFVFLLSSAFVYILMLCHW